MRQVTRKAGRANGFASNEAFIEGLAVQLDLDNAIEVFRHVFLSLQDEILVYPTENYYYFTFPARGRVIWGSLSLYAFNRDQGVLGFGYAQKSDKFRDAFLPAKGGGATLTAKHGVKVRKVSDLCYRVSFEGKTVTFRLNHEKLKGPRKSQMRSDEVFVGPSFDESGLQFYLLFNRSANCLYWMLNETPAGSFAFTALAKDLLVEDRTEFAFYVDAERRRKILIGVEGFNVLQNNWYDGPFDQMPDNYVHRGEIEVQKYLEMAYPHLKGKIDKYGNYLDRAGSRIAVAPYLVYFYRSELVDTLNRCKSSRLRGAKFLAAITRQIFKIPREFAQIRAMPPTAPAKRRSKGKIPVG